MTFTCMPLASFIFSLFNANHFFVKSWHPYAHSHPDRGSKCTQDLLKNGHILIKNVLLKINIQDEGHLDDSFLIYILTIYSECLHFQFLTRGIRGIKLGA